jgi:hypothetical protein
MSFGAWTEKAIRKYIDKVVPEGFTLTGYTGNYVVTDDYRPHLKWTATTPAEALRKAGVHVPKDCCGYN